jgi:hypothetical protein
MSIETRNALVTSVTSGGIVNVDQGSSDWNSVTILGVTKKTPNDRGTCRPDTSRTAGVRLSRTEHGRLQRGSIVGISFDDKSDEPAAIQSISVSAPLQLAVQLNLPRVISNRLSVIVTAQALPRFEVHFELTLFERRLINVTFGSGAFAKPSLITEPEPAIQDPYERVGGRVSEIVPTLDASEDGEASADASRSKVS